MRREEAAAFSDAPIAQGSGARGVSSGAAGRKTVDVVPPDDDDDEGDSTRARGHAVGRPRGKSTAAVQQRVDGDEAGLDDDDVGSTTPAPGRPRGRRSSTTVQGSVAAPVAPTKDGRKRRREED